MFLNDWQGGCIEDVAGAFEIPQTKLAGVEVLLASYTYEHYEGSAFVLFRRDGQLFEVNGSHCSCYGLEGQWDPEETTVEALMKRIDCNYSFEGFREELRQVLTSLN